MSTCVYFGCRLGSSVAFPVASPVPARTVKTGFRLEGVSILTFWPLVRTTKKHGKRDETPYRKQTKRSVISARGRNQKTHPRLIDFGTSSAPKSTLNIPKATQEASRSGWMTTAAKSRGQERPRHASKGFRVPFAGKCEFRRGLREGSERAPSNRFCSPRPPGDGQLSKKSI